MRAVDLAELQNRLAEYVRLAAAGERVLVEDQGRVVAELTAPRPDLAATAADPDLAATAADEVLADLVGKGLATPPGRAAATRPRSGRQLPLAQLLADLDHDRADR